MAKLTCGVSTTSDLVSTINSNTLTVPSAAGTVMSKLTNDAGDINILVSGDSTGNSSDEWVRLLADWYAAQFPVYSVDYYIWNDATPDYDAAESISTGTGSNTLSIYNASISGSKPDHIAGDRWQKAVLDVPQCDLIILNHGHNMITSYSDTDVSPRRVPQFIESVLSLLDAHSSAGFIIFTQNPKRDDDTYNPVYRAIIECSSLLGADVADSYSLFIADNKISSLYSDNTHPSASGTQLYLSSITSLHASLIPKSLKFSISETSANILTNGDMSDFTGAIPANWTGSNATTVKETTIYEGRHGWSVDLSPTAAGTSSRLHQSLSTEDRKRFANEWLTLAVRVYIPSVTSTATAGRVAILSSSSPSNTYTQSSGGRDGFKWIMASLKVGPSDTYVHTFLYGDSGTGNGEAIFDRAILVKGRIPKDVY